jgi:hypothetical protein
MPGWGLRGVRLLVANTLRPVFPHSSPLAKKCSSSRAERLRPHLLTSSRGSAVRLVGHYEDVKYIGRAPAPPLDRFIDDIYCLTGVPRHRRLNIPPMPSAHLLINLAGPIRLYDSDPAVPPAVFTDGWFMGVWTRRFLIEYQTPVQAVGCTSSRGGFRRSSTSR